jgi:hypothetical protein
MHDVPVNEDWNDRLAGLLDEGVAALGREAVRKALDAEIDKLGRSAGPAPLVVEVPVLGVVDCAAGWVAVRLRPSEPATVHVGGSVSALVEHVREAGDLAVVAIGKRAGSSGPKVAEVDAWVRTRPTVSVLAVPAGVPPRRADLEAEGLVPPAWYSGSGIDEEGLLQACAAAWAAARHAAGDAGALASIWV